jgi:glycerol-3-phosphate O-acyltransferase
VDVSEAPSTAPPDPGPTASRPTSPPTSIFDRWFTPVNVPHEAEHDLAELARRGSIVFVMRAAGVLNFLYLAWLLRRFGLPPLRAALGLTGFMPWLLRVRSSSAALEEAAQRGESSVVFLTRARGSDPFPLLVALQRRLPRPILLVPALLVWTRRPQKLKPTLGELLFGTPDMPSRFANAVGFLLNHRRAVLRVGRESDLAAFVGEQPQEPDALLGRKVRGALHFHLAHQVSAVVGPPLKTAARIREQVLRDKSLRAAIERLARETGRPLSDLQAEAERDLREIASRFSPAWIEILRPIVGWILRRLYDAVDVDEEGLARMKRAAADAPIVVCPSHKSHVDYLVLFWLFYEYGITLPHVAAGINLAFWPFGALARRGGAFFIRRSLRGDPVYTATLRAYVKHLLRDRFPQEFFVEGGRSRSGKLLFPKTGLVSMEVDAWLDGATDDVLFVPIAIDYELLMEGGSYARELGGADKTKEDFRGLLKARKVLGRRYGRLTVQFEEPVSLKAFTEQRLGERSASLTLDDETSGPPAPGSTGAATASADSKRELVQSLANRIAYGINRASTVTPVGLVACALLAHQRRGIHAVEVARRVELLRYIAHDNGARFSHGLAGAPSSVIDPGPIADAVARLSGEGLIRVERAAGETICQVVEERRPLLDYHKNAVIHRYVPLCLIAVSVRSGTSTASDEVRRRTRWLSRLFKLEFMYRVGATFDQIFDENTAFLQRLGVVREAEGRLDAGRETDSIAFLAEMLRPYLEAYRLAFETLLALDRADPAAGTDRRGLVKAALEHGRAAHAAGRVAARESISRAIFENAAEWLFQQGALTPVEGGRARLAASWREKKLPELIRELDATLPG